MNTDRPHRNCYWVQPGRLLAGEYPGHQDPAVARQRLERYLDAGVTYFVDLTQPHELEPYEGLLQELAAGRELDVGYQRLSIRDVDVPRSPVEMKEILDTIDAALAEGHTVYVHCWGGVGRTGTVVGCHLVRHGSDGQAALDQIAQWWQTVDKRRRHPVSPETASQANYVRQWQEPD